MEPRNFPKPIERETKEFSLLSIGLKTKIRLTTRQISTTLTIHRSEKRELLRLRESSLPLAIYRRQHTTFEQPSSFFTIQSYHRREDLPRCLGERETYSPRIINSSISTNFLHHEHFKTTTSLQLKLCVILNCKLVKQNFTGLNIMAYLNISLYLEEDNWLWISDCTFMILFRICWNWYLNWLLNPKYSLQNFSKYGRYRCLMVE